MMCYKDMTFCTFDDCAHFGVDCPRSLTDEEKKRAGDWWGKWSIDKKNAPICVFLERPKCFKVDVK